MTDLLHDIDAPSDAELISRVRGGDVAAYGELFSRHVDAARRLARQLVRGPDADDLVSDAFAKVLGVLQGGGGPDVAFRAYLLTAVRRLHVDKIRAGAKLQTSDDMEAFDAGVPFQDTAVAAFESGAAAKAFASLPERWQLVLWHLEVEGQKPADIAPLLGMSANSVSALAYRAREGLRQAFLTMHLNDTSDTSCRWVNEHLGAYVRNGLAKRDAAKVQSHLDECRRCTAMYLELTEVNSNLRGIIAPLLLGAAAAGYLSSTGAAAGGGFGLVAFFGRAREVVTANAGAATAGAVAAGVAAVATAGILLLPSSGPEDTVAGADDPIGAVTTPGVPDGEPSPGDRSDGPAGAEDDAEADEGTAASEEPALEATPDAVPVGEAGAESTADAGPGSEGGAPGSETGGGEQPGGDNPGGEPTAGPTGGPTDGPTSGPTDGPTSGPTDGPTSGPTDGPSSGPTNGPTSGPTSGPSPSEEPTPPTEEPPPVQFSIQVTALKVEDGQVSFDFDGVLPPVVYLSIDSEPASVLFTDGGTCKIQAGGATATCDLEGTTQSLLAPLARIAAAVTQEPFVSDATVRLTTPTEDSTVTIAMAADAGGPALATETFTVKAPATPTADVSLALPETIAATEALDYEISPATITGVPADYDGPLTFHLSSVPPSEAVFVGDKLCEVRDEGSTLVCSEAPTSFTVRVKNNNDPTSVTITLDPLTGIADPNAANNTDTVVLKAFRPADLKISADPQLDGNAGKGIISVVVADAPAAPVVVTASFDSRDIVITDAPELCTATPGALECAVEGPAIDALDFGVELVERPANETHAVTFRAQAPGYVELNPADNEVVVPVERKLGGTGGGGSAATDPGSTEPESTVDGLAPSAPASPVAQTLEATAETLTSLAEDVTRADRQASAKPTTKTTESTRTTKAGKVSKTLDDKTLDDKALRASRVEPEKTTQTPLTTSAAADKRDADADRTERKAAAEEQRAERKASDTDATSSPAESAPTSDDGGLVETVVKAVKNIL